MKTSDARAQRVIEVFERLQPADVAQLGRLYTDDAHFKDPFNTVQGLPAIQRIFGHMFVALDGPRFEIIDVLVQGDQCFLSWDFVFRMKRFRRDEQRIHGSSHLRFAPDGRVAVHRDYWDAAEELYEKLPVVGGLMRWLKKRANS
ncbi:MAG: nuclear transport factor 2 family protein [Rubrivivax sp.]|nr:nuclear transport factor 2 family protein [Rubrivivax sp.]